MNAVLDSAPNRVATQRWSGELEQRHDCPDQRCVATRFGWRGGFTLVELLVVVGIIALLVAIALPALARSRRAGRAAVCAAHLKTLSTALTAYAVEHKGSLVVSHWSDRPGEARAWDFVTTRTGSDYQTRPGLLWGGDDRDAYAQQCPSFDGPSNAAGEAYSGYNYNASYLGGGRGEASESPARLTMVGDPAATLAFGEGQFGRGANKFMRAPRHVGPDGTPARDGPIPFRAAGAQGFRHDGRTQAAHVDGHVESFADRGVVFDRRGDADGDPASLGDTVGFIGDDNALYDLE